MSVIALIILVFFMLGVIDKLIGDRFGLGKELEKGFLLFAPMVFSMLGMLVVAPAIGVLLTPFFEWFYTVFKIDPSIISASLLANDMGGTTLSLTINHNADIGKFNAYIISSMMGATISYTIPVALGIVKKEQHRDMFFGLLCGIVTIPIGSIVAGLICGIKIGTLMLNLLPLILFSSVVILGLIFIRGVFIKLFSIFGQLMRAISLIGLFFAVFTFLTDIEICKYFDSFENAAFICVNACVTLGGALCLMHTVSRLLNRPIKKICDKVGLDDLSALGLLTNVVSNTPVFGVMERMNRKGVVLCSAFSVSAAFTFGGHLAFTMAYDKSYVLPMIVGKMVSGIVALALALILYRESKTDSLS